MVWNILLLMLLLMLLIPVRLDIEYDDRLTVSFRCFGIKKDVGRHKTEKSAEKKMGDKSADEKTKKNKRAEVKTRFLEGAKAGVSFWGTRLKAYSKLLRMTIKTCCKLKTIKLTGNLFCIDVALTGLVFGLINSILATLKPRKCVDVTIVPGFVDQKTNVKFFFSAYVWLAGLVCWIVILVVKFLIDLVHFKKVGREKPGKE
ncbi:MAG: hypothetical protein LBB04_00925 [Oscillospiraceae bacterium]|jgi:hypothetical protein|nr:hypothetical protein [Oscillospiraceae bacterium]